MGLLLVLGGATPRANGIGVLLFICGLLVRRPPGKPIPEIPHALERLQGMGLRRSFIAGIVIADYQGPVASCALASTSLSFSGEMAGLSVDVLVASGIPFGLMVWTTRSDKARHRVTRATTWVMRNRRKLASWFAIIGGLLLVGDGILSLLTDQPAARAEELDDAKSHHLVEHQTRVPQAGVGQPPAAPRRVDRSGHATPPSSASWSLSS